MPGSTGWPGQALYDPTTIHGAAHLSFGLVGFPLSRVRDAANDPWCEPIDPAPIPPPPKVRRLDDLSVRRAEREFLRS